MHLLDWGEDENGTKSLTGRNITLTGSRMPTCTMGLQMSFIANHSQGRSFPDNCPFIYLAIFQRKLARQQGKFHIFSNICYNCLKVYNKTQYIFI